MTNTPMSEREKELVEATKAFFAAGSMWGWPMKQRVEKAIAAYDPKPEKEYTMPHWNVFTEGMTYIDSEPHLIEGWRVRSPVDPSVAIGQRSYNAIREALSKPKAPTE